jgi:hypothetical protein
MPATGVPALDTSKDTGSGDTGIVPEFDSSIVLPLPEGVSREAKERQLEGAHGRCMGEQ